MVGLRKLAAADSSAVFGRLVIRSFLAVGVAAELSAQKFAISAVGVAGERYVRESSLVAMGV